MKYILKNALKTLYFVHPYILKSYSQTLCDKQGTSSAFRHHTTLWKKNY